MVLYCGNLVIITIIMMKIVILMMKVMKIMQVYLSEINVSV